MGLCLSGRELHFPASARFNLVQERLRVGRGTITLSSVACLAGSNGTRPEGGGYHSRPTVQIPLRMLDRCLVQSRPGACVPLTQPALVKPEPGRLLLLLGRFAGPDRVGQTTAKPTALLALHRQKRRAAIRAGAFADLAADRAHALVSGRRALDGALGLYGAAALAGGRLAAGLLDNVGQLVCDQLAAARVTRGEGATAEDNVRADRERLGLERVGERIALAIVVDADIGEGVAEALREERLLAGREGLATPAQCGDAVFDSRLDRADTGIGRARGLDLQGRGSGVLLLVLAGHAHHHRGNAVGLLLIDITHRVDRQPGLDRQAGRQTWGCSGGCGRRRRRTAHP